MLLLHYAPDRVGDDFRERRAVLASQPWLHRRSAWTLIGRWIPGAILGAAAPLKTPRLESKARLIFGTHRRSSS